MKCIKHMKMNSIFRKIFFRDIYIQKEKYKKMTSMSERKN